MIRRQNSEKIFLQPIDQQYDNTLTKSESDENKKFFDDYEQKTFDYLNMSTDSETQRHNSFEDFYDSVKITTCLVEDWQINIEQLKKSHSVFLKNVIMQKMTFLRGSLNYIVNNKNRAVVNLNSSASEQVNNTE
jgi:hypothetical protein